MVYVARSAKRRQQYWRSREMNAEDWERYELKLLNTADALARAATYLDWWRQSLYGTSVTPPRDLDVVIELVEGLASCAEAAASGEA